MTSQSKLNVGDIITIGASRKNSKHLLVVRSQLLLDDPGDGVPYRVHEIDVVPTGWDNDTIFDSGLRSLRPEGGQVTNGAMKSFYFEGGSMTGKGKPIKTSDVKVVGMSKVKTYVTVTYTMSKTKYYG